MKGKRIFAAAVLLLVLLLAAALFGASRRSLSFSTGTCLMAENGSCLLILDNSPIVLSNCTSDESLFSDFVTGDRLLVLHDGIQETYPARTGAYGAWKLRGKDAVSQRVIDSLTEMGWRLPAFITTFHPDELTDAAVSWANYDGSGALFAAALNRDKMAVSSVQHLPILKFETADQLDDFKKHYGDRLTTEQGYDEVPSFAEVTAHMDGDYFEKYTLFLVYLTSGSCSYRYEIDSLQMQGNALCVHVRQANDPDFGDCAMAGWFLTAAMEKEQLAGITVFDADLQRSST